MHGATNTGDKVARGCAFSFILADVWRGIVCTVEACARCGECVAGRVYGDLWVLILIVKNSIRAILEHKSDFRT